MNSQWIIEYGWKKTFQVLREAKIISQQNRAIRKKQIDGTYWTHSQEEFLDTLNRVGFEVLQAGRTYRNISDWAMVRKPRAIKAASKCNEAVGAATAPVRLAQIV